MTTTNPTPTQPLAGAELPTEREALLGDIEWLLAEGRKIATDEAPDEGRHFDHKFQAIRRLMTGQTVGISLRYLERIIAALKATPPAPQKSRPLTIGTDIHSAPAVKTSEIFSDLLPR